MTEISVFKFLECALSAEDLHIRKRKAEVQKRKNFGLLLVV